MNTRLKQEDKELDHLERLIRETPIEVDLVNRTMNKYESKRNTHNLERIKTHRKISQRMLMATVSAAIILNLIFITGLISPTMAATMKQVPVLSSIFKLAGDLGLQTADEKGLSTKTNKFATNDGVTLQVPEVVYDGTRVAIGIERLNTEGEFSKETLGELISNIEMTINDISLDSFAPQNSNSIGIYQHPGKDSDSVIIEFSDLSNQGGIPLPEQFDLALNISLTGVQDPFIIDIPVNNNVDDYLILQPNVNREYKNINYIVEKVQFTPVTTNITTRITLSDKSNLSLPILSMGVDIFDEQGHKLHFLNGNSWNETNGDTLISDYRFQPFESIPKNITIKPYVHIYENEKMGIFKLDENNEPIIKYIPELEITLPIN